MENNTITKLDSFNIIIIGDLMLDKYIYGKVKRISPEAPVPVFEKHSTTNKPGGAANVALNIKAMGSTPYLIGLLGEDVEGSELENILNSKDISTDFIVKSNTRPTTTKTRIMSSGQHILRIDEEDIENINAEIRKKIIDKFDDLTDSTTIHGIIFQDYDKGLLDDEIIKYIIRKSKEKNIFTAVDPKFRNFLSYKNVDFFKPNLKEIGDYVQLPKDITIEKLNNAYQFLKSSINPEKIFITLSDKGIYYNSQLKNGILPASRREIVDVSGAGDVVISISTILFLMNTDIEKIACISNIAGGIACGHLGVAVVSKEEILNGIEKVK
ncbi:MAG: bifunctional ADP-heptose synthase [Saprospiraceae bacterium]